MVSQHSAKFGGYRYCGSRDLRLLVIEEPDSIYTTNIYPHRDQEIGQLVQLRTFYCKDVSTVTINCYSKL